MIQAHGANYGAICAKCQKQNDRATLEKHISSGEVMYCTSTEDCGGPMKPEITFFGEKLPPRFDEAMEDLEDVDLLIVIGTSLKVAPFNLTVYNVPEECPKVLINLNNTDESGFEFDNPEKYPERLLLQGRSQDIIKEIAEACGWKE